MSLSRRYMEAGLGVLELAPGHFWPMTPVELKVALDGRVKAMGGHDRGAPPTREELDEMMARFPD